MKTQHEDYEALVRDAIDGLSVYLGKRKASANDLAKAFGFERSIVYRWLDGIRKPRDHEKNTMLLLQSLWQEWKAIDDEHQAELDAINEKYNLRKDVVICSQPMLKTRIK